MSKKLEEKKNEKKSSPDSEIMKAVHRTGVKPVEVKEPFDKSGQFSGRHHNGVDGVVTKFTTKSGVATVSGAPITSDGQNDVDGSGRDYREVVEVRPHMIPTEVGKKPTRYARKQRGKSPGSYRQGSDMKHYGKKAPWAELQTQCHAFQRDGKTKCGAQSRKGSKFCHLPEHSSAKQGIQTMLLSLRRKPKQTPIRTMKDLYQRAYNVHYYGFGAIFIPHSLGWLCGSSA